MKPILDPYETRQALVFSSWGSSGTGTVRRHASVSSERSLRGDELKLGEAGLAFRAGLGFAFSFEGFGVLGFCGD